MLTSNQIWQKVKTLKGTTINTYTQNKPNKITDVTNNEIIIEDRKTRPIKEDIVMAYNLLFDKGKLERKRDLLEFAQLNKQTSSIIFRIVGELAKDEIMIIKKKTVVLKLKN